MPTLSARPSLARKPLVGAGPKGDHSTCKETLHESDTHIAFVVDDFDAAHELHEKMGCIIRENPRMGLYFIADPEGQWIEILPAR